MMASPTAASAAATAITKKTNTCPPTPRRCARATKVRFTALSISSTHMKITMALRRSSTPATPSVNSTAEMARAGPRSTLEFSLGEHHRADDRGEEEQHHDRARVHQHLQGSDELSVEQDVHRGQREQRHHEPQRAHHGAAPGDAEHPAQHRDDPEDPEERQRHVLLALRV